MTEFTYLDKLRKGNKIVQYKLKDSNNNIFFVDANTLKRNIQSGTTVVQGLKLTSDNRLIEEKVYETYLSKKQGNKIIIRDAKKPYDAESYNEFIGRLIYLMEKALKIKENNGSIEIEDVTLLGKEISNLAMVFNLTAVVPVYLTYKVKKDNTGYLKFQVYKLEINDRDTKSKSFKTEFTKGLNMKADFKNMLKIADAARIEALNLVTSVPSYKV